jgi:tetratricopeptide (TPR) repeat protein
MKNAGTPGVLLLALIWDVLVLFAFANGSLAAWVAALLHAAMIAAMVAWIALSPVARLDLRIPVLLAVTTAVLGPAGPLGTALTIAACRRFARSAVPFEEWYEGIFPKEDAELEAALERHARALIAGESEGGVVPFIDVLSFGSRQQKQAMIAMITSRFHPSFAPVLRMALNDSNQAIRVQAATAMTRVENGFLEKSLELAQAAGDGPADPELVLRIARHYDSYAFAGILDEKRENENREKAAEAYIRYLELRSGDHEICAEAGRLLVRKGDYLTAAALLREALRQGDASPAVVLWYMESLFRLKRYAELRKLANAQRQALESDTALPAEVSEAVRIWAGADLCGWIGGRA